MLKIDRFVACSSGADLRRAAVAGEAIAVLSLPVLKNLSFLDSFFAAAGWWAYVLVFLWLLLVPAFSMLGIEIAARLISWHKSIFELAKYGLVGWLNVFINIGVFNFLSWGLASRRASGRCFHCYRIHCHDNQCVFLEQILDV